MNVATETGKPPVVSLVWGVLAVLSACVMAFAFRIRDCFVDDAYIGFQYLDNLRAGHGFVFHSGSAPVEGVSNIGWLLLLAPFADMAEPMVVAKLLGLALVLLALILTVCLGEVLAAKTVPTEDSFSLVFPPVLMLVSSFEFVYFSLAGMETALLAVILLAMCCVALKRPHAAALPLLGAAAFLTHPEAVLVYPFYAALCWCWSKDDRQKLLGGNITSWGGSYTADPLRHTRGGSTTATPTMRLLGGTLVLAGLVGGITLARFGYFGDVLPNTFYAKPSNVQQAIHNAYGFFMGQNTNVPFPLTGWLAAPLLVWGYVRLRRAMPAAADMLAAVCGTGLLMAVYSLPDWTALPRYFAPYLPAALILFWAGLNEAIQAAVAQPRMRQLAGAAIMVLLVLTSVVDGQNKIASAEEFPGYVLAGKNLVAPSLWVRDHLPAGATIATRRIGALAYYSHRPVFDYTYGLPDRQVAHLVASAGHRFDTPNDEALAAVWRDRAPEYILEDGLIVDHIAALAGGTRQRFSVHGVEYRLIEQFPIGHDAQWVLARRAAN